MRTKIKFQFRVPNDPVETRLDKFLTSEMLQHHSELHMSDSGSIENAITEPSDSTESIAGLIEQMNRSRWQDLIEKGHVWINGTIAKASQKIQKDDLIEFSIEPSVQSVGLVAANIPLDIVFEDKDLIVVNKPAGLVVHPAAGHEQDTLVNALLYHTRDLSMKNEERPGIVHRIDKETSGLLVVAKNDLAHERLAEQFKNKTTHRIYYAIAEAPKKSFPKKGRIESNLARHPSDRKRYASLAKMKNEDLKSTTGKHAITHYEVLEQSDNKILVKLILETGRTHQIRVHLKELGSIIVGDTLYGFSKLKYEQLGLSRFYLHAAEVGFVHPTTSERLMFKCSWPQADLGRIREWGFRFEF